jgi:RsiW-degrading membrane proteinase PrsW (M82 family)
MFYSPIYIVSLGFAAIVSVAMWLDYFRQIDVFEKEKLWPLILALLIGGCTPTLSLYIYRLMGSYGFEEDGEFINDALYSVLGIGLNEELCKLAGILLVFVFLKKKMNEPIDYLIYAGVTALGFSLVENFNYFYNHGIRIITSRTFYSALEHIINSTMIVYGFYRARIFGKGHVVLNSLTGLVLAVLSHGMFDFFLTKDFLGIFTPFLSLLVYLVGINFWVQMLNNANNYSPFFDYHKINFTPRLVFRLFYWYLLTVLIAVVNNVLVAGFRFSALDFAEGILSDGFLFWIVILRVSRFKIFKMKYFRVELALPFYFTRNGDEDIRIPFINLPLKIRGENVQEHLLTKYLYRKIELYPVDASKSLIKQPTEAVITGKFLLFDDVIVYGVTIGEIAPEAGRQLVLKPRMRSIGQLDYRYPIEGLYSLPEEGKPGQLSLINCQALHFIEWVYLKPED